MKYIIGLLLVSLAFYAFGQEKTSVEWLTIQSEIMQEAQEHIKDLQEFHNLNLGMQIYNSNVYLEYYENDSLIVSTRYNPKSIISKSFYLWKGDTLIIDGGIGFAVGSGFSLQVIKNKAKLYHMVSSDEIPTYAYGENTDLIYRLEVPCHEVKVVLSELPLKGSNQIIYGYVEFKSDNYFSSGETLNGKEIGSRKKLRANMKMYFRSGLLTL